MPILVVGPALGVTLYVYRDRLNKARKKCCACLSRSIEDAEGGKVENANNEFSHELQHKVSENVYSGSANTDWVKLDNKTIFKERKISNLRA